MPGFLDTLDLERELLSHFIGSIMYTRRFVVRLRSEMFTSDERKFIAKSIRKVFDQTKSPLAKGVFEFEVGRAIRQKDQEYYLAEWAIVEATVCNDTPEAILDRLDEVLIGRRLMDAAEQIVTTLGNGNVQSALQQFKLSAVRIGSRTDDTPVVEITDYQHRLERIREKQQFPERFKGIRTGFRTIDIRSGGLWPAELTLIAGLTGVGKSALVKQFQYGIITNNHRKNVLHIANEESQEQVETKFDALLTGIPYYDFKSAQITDIDLGRWIDVMEKDLREPAVGRLFVKEVPAFSDATLIEQQYRELEAQGVKIDVITVDHLPHLMPIERAWSETDERFKAAADLKELARSLRVHVLVPTQAATAVAEKQEKQRRAGDLDVYGSKGQIHIANMFLIITLKGRLESVPPDGRMEDDRDALWLADCKKNRDGARFSFFTRHYVKDGRVEEVKNPGVVQGGTPEGREAARAAAEAEEATDSGADSEQDEETRDTGELFKTHPSVPEPVQLTIAEKMKARGIQIISPSGPEND